MKNVKGKRPSAVVRFFVSKRRCRCKIFISSFRAGSLDFGSFGVHGGRRYIKNPAQASSGVCLGTGNLFFLVLALGGLERIDFGTRLHGGRTDVRGHVAVADLPFERRIGTGCTIPAGLDFHFTAAAAALFHGRMANPAVKRTALCGHERALSAFSDGCTNHWNHPLESFNVMNTNNKTDRIVPPARLKKQSLLNL